MFNQRLFEFIFSLAHRNSILDVVGVLISSYVPYLVVLGLLVFLMYEKEWRRRLFFLLEAILATLLARGIVTETIRFFYAHPRPPETLNIIALVEKSGNSFPSGHMAFFFALAMILFYIHKKWGTWLFIIVGLMGITRVFVGVHWPLDIVGGALVGVLSGVVMHSLVKRYMPGTVNSR